MFDWVNYEMKCPKCKTKIDGFQSKDGECCLSMLEVGDVANFYSSCDTCNTWIEFQLDKKNITIKHYKMLINKRRRLGGKTIPNKRPSSRSR